MRTAPELLEVDSKQLEDVLRRAEQSLDEEDSHLIRRLFESYAYVSDLIEDKNTSIRRLRQLLFGGRTEKTEAVAREKTEAADASAARRSIATPIRSPPARGRGRVLPPVPVARLRRAGA